MRCTYIISANSFHAVLIKLSQNFGYETLIDEDKNSSKMILKVLNFLLVKKQQIMLGAIRLLIFRTHGLSLLEK